MIDWGKKKYGPQGGGIQIGPRVVNKPVQPKPVMSKAGTPMPANPMKVKTYQSGGRSNVLPNKPKPPTGRKYNPKVR